MVKNLPATRETWVRSLGWKDPLEKGKAIHCSILESSMHCIVGGVAELDTTFTFAFVVKVRYNCICKDCGV